MSRRNSSSIQQRKIARRNRTIVQSIMVGILFSFSILALVFALGKFSYFGNDGFGVFVAGVGGYHVAFDDSESGVYQ